MRNNFTQVFKKIVLLALFVFIIQPFLIVRAQEGGVAPGETVTTNPKARDVTVSASVPDIVDPSAPFLIAPENNSLINDATPNFIWQQSTDNVGVSYYELYLDGVLTYESIPTSNTTNAIYTLVYDGNSGQYTLTPSQSISQGTHTWYIQVYDAAGNTNTSATWTFTIDTLAPSFTIQTIGPIATAISAQDIESVPDNPIELEDNEPVFTGQGEANAAVQVTVQIPNQSNQILNFDINPDGTWSFQLGILPRDTIITLDFVITDQAGNISVITDLQILIIQEYIIFPPTPVPTPTPSPTPTPIDPTQTPPPTPPSTPLVTPPPPIIKIPILPPEEVVEIIKDTLVDAIPDPVANILQGVPEEIRKAIGEAINSFAPTGAFVVSVAVPAISFLTLLLQLGQQLSFELFFKILQAIGLLPPKEPQGMVFDSQTNEPVPFALLTITSKEGAQGEGLLETVVTDVDGIYQGIQLPTGLYSITVSHQDFNFPTNKARPSYLNMQEFYKGELFEVKSSDQRQLFLIPVDRKNEVVYKKSLKKVFLNIVKNIRFKDLFWPLFVFSLVITLFYPTLLNFIVLSIYFILLFKRIIASFKRPNISGFVTTTDSIPIENAIVRISNPKKGELLALIRTNKQGYYQAFVTEGKYQIQINKSGFVWQQKNSGLSLEEIDVRTQPQVCNAQMKEVGNLYDELFTV